MLQSNKNINVQLPLVSVIMPCFNCSEFIIEALDSIIQQNYKPIEIIIVDDGSTDDSVLIIKNYPEKIKLLKQNNQGPAAARNKAIKEAKGEYLAFLDADDVWLKNKLLPQIKYLEENPEIDIVYGGFERWEADKTGGYCRPKLKSHELGNNNEICDPEFSGWIYHKLLLDNYIHIITAVIRRSLFYKLNGFDSSLKTGEDYDLWLRATRRSKVCKFYRSLALYRINTNSTTHIPREINNEKKVLLKAISDFGIESPDGSKNSKYEIQNRMFKLNIDHAFLHYKHGSSCIALKSFKEALRYSKNKFKLNVYIIICSFKCFIEDYFNH